MYSSHCALVINFTTKLIYLRTSSQNEPTISFEEVYRTHIITLYYLVAVAGTARYIM